MKKVSGKTLRDWADWLKEEDCGCCRQELITDDRNNVWSIIMGWSDAFGDGRPEVCVEIGYQPYCSMMSCDMDIDFLMPYDEGSGEVDDTRRPVGDSPDWDGLAVELNREAEQVISRWACLEVEEAAAA